MKPIDFSEKFDIWINSTLGQMIIFNIHDKQGSVNFIDNEERTYTEVLEELYVWKLNKNDVRQLVLSEKPTEKLDEMKQLRDLIVKAKREREILEEIMESNPNVIDFSKHRQRKKKN